MRRTSRFIAIATLLCVTWTLVTRADDGISASDAELQFQLANLLFEETRYREAYEAFEKASHAPDRTLAFRAKKGQIRTALLMAEFKVARAEADVLRRDAPGDPETQTLYADSLWSAGLFDEADAIYSETLARHPGVSRARYGVARSLASRNRLDEALTEALAASAAAPRDGDIHHEIGEIYERLQRYDEAANVYSNFINLLPNKDCSERAAWSRAQVTFLRAFEGKKPVDVEGATDRIHTIPFRLVSGKVVVQASINGRRPLDIILDTGSEQTVVSDRTADRVGVQSITYTLSAGVGDVGLRGLQLGRLDSLEIGSLRVRNVPVLIKSPGLRDVPKREADTFSPLALGLSVTIDYRNRLVRIGYRLATEPAGPNDIELPMRFHRLAMVRGTLNKEHPAYFVVDTGGEVISISTATANTLQMQPVRHIPLKVWGVSGWDRDAFLLPGVNLDFDEIQYRNFPVVVLNLRVPSVLLGFEVGGIVGYRFFEQYRVTLDLANSELRLSRN